MAKSKAPSPQEAYRARKAREERERSALLPPGLLNHGNTCFMNSVLQGLIATRYLQLAVLFQPLPPPPLQSFTPSRSPALASSHALAGELDRPWSDALPIGDRLLAVLRIAWDIQNNRKREHISPKDILAELGKKYDQYLDFRQQDAHEFLCQLLDAVRMEEMDLIKRRSPPNDKPSPSSRSRHSTPSDGDGPSSFVDMLFGGKLASILVCQACKHVSHTYEDFTDLSLSMKPEDYVRERKRDRLKQFAKKIGTAFYGVPQQRSSSVPATPVCPTNLDSPEPNDSQRRRSIDLAQVDIPLEPTPDVVNDTAPQVPPSPSPVADSPWLETPSDTPLAVLVADLTVPAPPHDSPDHVVVALPEKVNGKERRDKDESWAKISRRITVSVGLAMRPKAERRERKRVSMTPSSRPADDATPSIPPAETETAPSLEREPTSLGAVNEKLQAHLTNVKRSVMPTSRAGNSPSGSSAPRFPLISRPSSPIAHAKTSKPPRPPKLGTEEAAYLRDILADINPPGIQKPFSIFKQSRDLPSVSTSQHLFLKVNQINKIEECLRLFTSVEVLDGDNTVRCHRCWKIANGFYKPRAKASAEELDSCTDSEDDEKGPKDTPESIPPRLPVPAASCSSGRSPSRSTTSLHDIPPCRDTLTQPSTRASSKCKQIPPALQLNDDYPIELVSPVNDEPSTSRTLSVPLETARPPGSPRLSLGARWQRSSRSGDSNTESEISEGESEAMLSVYSDVSSARSSDNPSPSASRDHLQPPPSPTVETHGAKEKAHPSGVPRSRQYVLRPAYKRYLIATPPPILVVHLKRFQQLSKTPVVSFSTGFKKMDDYISFPELLDLAPYLAPRREDYFDSKVAVTRGRAKRPAPCMYRLYAVVVHIGNMLGGHYVAYAALPPTPPPPEGDGGETSRDWAFVSDTVVRLASLDEVLKSKAYMCMYERI